MLLLLLLILLRGAFDRLHLTRRRCGLFEVFSTVVVQRRSDADIDEQVRCLSG